jgi:hypothetical protein
VVAAMLLITGVAGAQVTYEFHCSGTGDMLHISPPIYGGTIPSGDLAPGTWQMTVDDAGWAPPSNPTARWADIWAYYIYDPGFQNWTATFDCALFLEKTGAGTMQGVNDLTFQIIDMNDNAILDPEECMDGVSGAVIIIEDGTGIYTHLCGDGTYSGYYFRDCDTLSSTYWNDYTFEIDMTLDLEDCGMATDVATWGAVKSLFK